MEKSKLPLGICKQAIMKLESAMVDLKEVAEDEDVSKDDREMFDSLGEYVGNVIAVITNAVMGEMEEDAFLAEELEMDEIEPYPGEVADILDELIGEQNDE